MERNVHKCARCVECARTLGGCVAHRSRIHNPACPRFREQPLQYPPKLSRNWQDSNPLMRRRCESRGKRSTSSSEPYMRTRPPPSRVAGPPCCKTGEPNSDCPSNTPWSSEPGTSQTVSSTTETLPLHAVFLNCASSGAGSSLDPLNLRRLSPPKCSKTGHGKEGPFGTVPPHASFVFPGPDPCEDRRSGRRLQTTVERERHYRRVIHVKRPIAEPCGAGAYCSPDSGGIDGAFPNVFGFEPTCRAPHHTSRVYTGEDDTKPTAAPKADACAKTPEPGRQRSKSV